MEDVAIGFRIADLRFLAVLRTQVKRWNLRPSGYSSILYPQSSLWFPGTGLKNFDVAIGVCQVEGAFTIANLPG